jgi:hypothetical protein
MIGTPKTINGAIENALQEYHNEHPDSQCTDEKLQTLIRLHVKDFLSQRFMVAMLTAEVGEFEPIKSLKKLYEEITQ